MLVIIDERVAGTVTYIVDTPASTADDNVNAVAGNFSEIARQPQQTVWSK
jgi:hypothetical protein